VTDPTHPRRAGTFAWQRALLAASPADIGATSAAAARTTKLVGLALSVYANADGGSITVGQTRLARDANLTTRAVRACLHDLRNTSWIIRTRHGARSARAQTDAHALAIPLTSQPSEPTP
jgi:hypothetical protein